MSSYFSLNATHGGLIIDGYTNYTVDTKCSWLLRGKPDVPIRLQFNEFATECSWDHLYVYDGDSIYSPLVAVFRYICLAYAHKLQHQHLTLICTNIDKCFNEL